MLRPTPFRCHIFICTNDRQGARRSCADGQAAEIASALKERLRQLHPNDVRVSRSLCMGRCDQGPNLMIYPRGIWYSQVRIEDVETIVQKVDDLLAGREE